MMFQAPLRESAIDLICMTLETHPKSIAVAQAACRSLANLANTLYTVVSNKLDSCEFQVYLHLGDLYLLKLMYSISSAGWIVSLNDNINNCCLKKEKKEAIFAVLFLKPSMCLKNNNMKVSW